MFVRIGFVIGHGQRIRVIKHGLRFGESHPVFVEIEFGFGFVIPFEAVFKIHTPLYAQLYVLVIDEPPYEGSVHPPPRD